MKLIKKALSMVLTLCMVFTLMSTSIVAKAEENDSTFYRIFHLDAGRKYFSVDQIKTLIDSMAKNDYTHLELAIGNDGLRFLLDDMSVTANDTTYTSDAVKAGIQAGNKAYYDAGTNELTETEMDTIIAYAEEKGIEIIPLINTPGHMDAILDCMESVGISNPAYSSSARTVDVTNTAAVNFTLALVNKYITYFAGEGCTIFNMGCDEYANDVSNSGFAGLISSGKYGNFVTYVNNMAAQVKAAGMTPMAFNDGIYYNSNTSSGTFDSDIMIAYWTSGWSGYSPASASFLAEKRHKIINTNDAWYYVLGRQAGNSSGYTIATAQNGVQNTACTDIPGSNDPTASGCMICLWCDTPSASYSDTEVSNVTGLISTFATSNPAYFTTSTEETDPTEPSDPVEVTKNKTITVTVGDTATDTISDYNFAGTYTTEDPSIATIEVTGTDAIEATVTYTKVNSNPNWNTLISSNTTSATSYYYLASDGTYYQLYVTRRAGNQNNRYNYSLGYYANGSSTLTSVASATNSRGNSAVSNVTLYTKSGTEGTPASTTITFTGVTVGTTYVTVGNTRYTINVTAEDLSEVTPLTVEYWITNLPVTADDATSKAISAQSAYGEDGADISTLVPEKGTYAYGSVVYWKGTVLDSSNKQTSASGAENDKTGSGKDFSLIRYYNGNWQYYYEADGTWNTISDTDQVVIYWLQPTEVTKEITTLVKDWGFTPDAQGDNENKVALTVAVVYPDGTVSPAESDMYSTSTTLFNYWENRDIGLVAPVNNSDYEISKITVTDGTRDQSGTGKWGTSDTITWKKVTNEAGEEWYNETTYWDETVGGTPMVNGATSNITWSNYNTAKLVLIYLKPVHYDTNLNVKWVDDSAGGLEISSMEVAVSSDGTETTFYNGLVQSSELPAEGVGGTFKLDDDAYVTNSSNVKQTFNKNISTVPGVAEKYKSGLYEYVSAELSADGKTLTLHYNIDNTKLSKNYVVDFGLSVKVPLTDIADTKDNITLTNGTTTYGKAEITGDNLIYTPEKVLAGTDVVSVKVFDETVRIGFVPATTVYYEEGFATLSDNYEIKGSKLNTYQATQVAGESSDEYGYDAAYADDAAGASNGTYAVSATKGDTAQFSFTGTGVDLYVNSAKDTGNIAVQVRDADNKLVKVATVQTTSNSTIAGAYSNADEANLVAVSVTGLTYGNYTVKITTTSADGTEVIFDGFRVYGTLKDQENEVYVNDLEDNPTYIELRDYVLTAENVDNTESSAQIYAQVREKTTGELTGVVLTNNTDNDYDAQALLENGPKNELFLLPGESVVFKINTNREVQVGLKAPVAATSYSINSTASTITTSTDMFYTIANKAETASEQTFTIKNTGESLLSITKIKVCDDPEATLSELTEKDIETALNYLNGVEEPSEPEVSYADATLHITINDADGNELVTTSLGANGVEGEVYTFAAADIESAVEGLELPEGYKLDEVSYSDKEVVYGESDSVTFTASKEVTESTSAIGKIINSIIKIFGKIIGRG